MPHVEEHATSFRIPHRFRHVEVSELRRASRVGNDIVNSIARVLPATILLALLEECNPDASRIVAAYDRLDVRTTVDDRGFEGMEAVRVNIPRPKGVGTTQIRIGELVLLDTRLVRVEGDDAGAVVRHHRHARLSRRLEPCPERLVLRPTAVGITAGGSHSAEPARAEKQRGGGGGGLTTP